MRVYAKNRFVGRTWVGVVWSQVFVSGGVVPLLDVCGDVVFVGEEGAEELFEVARSVVVPEEHEVAVVCVGRSVLPKGGGDLGGAHCQVAAGRWVDGIVGDAIDGGVSGAYLLDTQCLGEDGHGCRWCKGVVNAIDLEDVFGGDVLGWIFGDQVAVVGPVIAVKVHLD